MPLAVDGRTAASADSGVFTAEVKSVVGWPMNP